MNQFDELFKKKLESLGIKYNDAHWKKMEDLLVNKKKQKRAFYIRLGYITTFVTGLIISMLFYFNTHNSQQELIVTDSPSSSEQNSEEPNMQIPVVQTDSKPFDEADFSLNHKKELNDDNQSKELNANNSVQSKSQPPDFKEVSTVEKESSGLTNQETENTDEKNFTLIQTAQLPLEIFSLRSINLLEIYQTEFQLNIAQLPLPENKSSGKKSDSMSLKSGWVHSLAGSYEYDMYRRKKNTEALKVNEKTLNSSGFNIHYLIRKNKLGFKTGLGYMQLVESTSYMNENRSYAYDTSYRMINPTYAQTSFGSNLALINREIDTTETISYAVDCPDCKVQLSYIKIPLLVSYEFKLKRVSLFVDAGVNASVLAGKKGSYTSYENNQFVVKDVKQSKDMNRFLFQTYTAIGIKYKLFNTLSVFGGYGLSNSINSMVKSYDQKPVIHQFSFGLGVDL